MRKFVRSDICEIYAVIGAQPANLALEVGPLHHKLTLLVDEAVPDIDIGDAGFFRPRAIKFVEVIHIACRFGATDCRQSDPEHRHALTLGRGNHVVDALFVKLGPYVGAKLVIAGRRPVLRLGRISGRLLGVGRRRVRRRRGICCSLIARRCLLRSLTLGPSFIWRRRALTQRQPIVHAQHDDNGTRLFCRQHIFDRLRPIQRVRAHVVAHKPRARADFAHDADVRGIRERLLKPKAKPIRERIADHEHERTRLRFDFARRRGLCGFERLCRTRRGERVVRTVSPKAAIAIFTEREAKEIAELHQLGPRSLDNGHAAANKLRRGRERQSRAGRHH